MIFDKIIKDLLNLDFFFLNINLEKETLPSC